jgi:hypothetical protein
MTPAPLWVLRLIEEKFHRDDEDRPLREGRTPPELLRAGEIEYRPCAYPGSRHQHANPMNVSALKQTGVHWDEIADALAFLRTAYAEEREAYGPDVMDLWRVSQLGSSLPWLFILRGGTAPAYAAALSKATQGTGLLAQRLFVRMLGGQWTPPQLTAEAILQLAEASDTLIGDTEVCSASDKMMLLFFQALVDGHHSGSAIAASREDILLFGAHYSGLKLTLWIYFLARRFLYADLVAALGQTDELRALLDGPCEPSDFYLVEPTDMAALPLDHRAYWFDSLASLIVPFAPDGSDAPLRVGAHQIAQAMSDPAPSGPITRAVATFARLDAIFGDMVETIEGAFRRVGRKDPLLGGIDAETRDRLLTQPPRGLFRSLGGNGFAALCRP